MLVCFHRIQNHRYGYQIGSSGLHHRRRFPPLAHSTPDPGSPDTPDSLTPKMAKMNLSSPQQAQSTKKASFPTWGQIKKLTSEAETLVSARGHQPTPEALFLAMLALLSCQVPFANANFSYWAYFPDPPLLHLASWGSQNIKVFTNNSDLMGGISNSLIPHRTSDKIDFEGFADDAPLCFVVTGVPLPGCLPINYRTFLTDSPTDNIYKRNIWNLEFISLGYHTYDDTYINLTNSFTFLLEACTTKFSNRDIY